MRQFLFILCPAILFIASSCSSNPDSEQKESTKLDFKYLTPKETGIDFSNVLDEDKIVNAFNYINAYNGGGVGIGDINNDGLQDVVFTGNMVSSKLYLNKGNLQFEDISLKSNFQFEGWATGVSMADINNDGWLDIYICRSYHDDPNLRKNLLFINNKNGTFSEAGSGLGVDDENYSIGASFFDYDKDGDLDLFVANHPRYRYIPLSMHLNYRRNPEAKYSSKLFRNDGNRFTDVTVESGILSYGFCLSVSTSDYNLDGWPDIFVTVDHEEEEMVFKNQGDGTFKYDTKNALKQNSNSSMGVDVGDINNDKYPDFVVVEMLPKDYYREKVSMSMQSVQKFTFLTDTIDYNYFQMRNFLHLNNGNGTFSDVGQLAGIHKSDWSWSCLLMDGDNDGNQDLFVANGYWRNLYNKDKKKKLDEGMMALNGDFAKMNKLASEYSKTCSIDKIQNVFFKKESSLTFSDVSTEAGLVNETVSCGAAYGDLDNDGDLDIVVNNIGEPSNIIENRINDSNNYLRIKMRNKNGTIAEGAKAYFSCGDNLQSRELLSARGYQSSSEPIIHFGMSENCQSNELQLVWPSGKTKSFSNVELNTVLEFQEENTYADFQNNTDKPLLKKTSPEQSGVAFKQQENDGFDDYEYQVLLPHKMSEQGPFISKADVTGDGLEDFYIGAPTGQAGEIYIQKKDGKFSKLNTNVFLKDKKFEDGGSAFVDIDGDKDMDLIVSSGGYEFDHGTKSHLTRVYINDGNSNFTRAANSTLDHDFASSCVRPFDFDNDGDIDIFIGGLLEPKKYPLPGHSALFINNGKGVFHKLENANFERVGMVKDAQWMDLNGDDKNDLIIVGEWMPISFWLAEGDNFVDRTSDFLNENLVGWWNCIKKVDLDNNGFEDLVIGNLGLNYKYKASPEKPFKIYSNDVDNSGSYDIMLSTFYDDIEYPVRGKTCSAEQIPDLNSKVKTFDEFSKLNMATLYGNDLDKTKSFSATEFRSLILYQDSIRGFKVEYLPLECQKAPINTIEIIDINNDKKQDLILAGNLYQSEIETGRADFGTGQVLLNKGKNNWKSLEVYESGLYIPGDVKSTVLINDNLSGRQAGSKSKAKLIVGNNNDDCEVYDFMK